ncbi:MAG: WS/DGAT domain-containing protein, partial [Mycobacterium sp.]|nr:WS/DGAT domain-containing protein [Mycobacterium sp.]
SLRDDTTSSGGNQVGALLATLATDLTDPEKRLEAVSASMRKNKEVFSQLPKLQRMALSVFNMSPLLLNALSPSLGAAAPPFNLAISNVPGSRESLYWNGARLDGNYPFSIALAGQAHNITLSNNADNLDFGLVGCRRSVPSLQRLLGHLEESLTDLERAMGTAARNRRPRNRWPRNRRPRNRRPRNRWPRNRRLLAAARPPDAGHQGATEQPGALDSWIESSRDRARVLHHRGRSARRPGS